MRGYQAYGGMACDTDTVARTKTTAPRARWIGSGLDLRKKRRQRQMPVESLHLAAGCSVVTSRIDIILVHCCEDPPKPKTVDNDAKDSPCESARRGASVLFFGAGRGGGEGRNKQGMTTAELELGRPLYTQAARVSVDRRTMPMRSSWPKPAAPARRKLVWIHCRLSPAMDRQQIFNKAATAADLDFLERQTLHKEIRQDIQTGLPRAGNGFQRPRCSKVGASDKPRVTPNRPETSERDARVLTASADLLSRTAPNLQIKPTSQLQLAWARLFFRHRGS